MGLKDKEAQAAIGLSAFLAMVSLPMSIRPGMKPNIA
jgi:hypothetical protein